MTTHTNIHDNVLRNFIKNYEEKINKLDKFRNELKKTNIIRYDNENNPIRTENHIMYRVNLGTIQNPIYKICPNGKNYYYEFLIEFDKNNSGYGIYYGCRAIIDYNIECETNEFLTIINSIDNEWRDYSGISKDEKISPIYIKHILNKVFKNKKDYKDPSFIPTNNYSDNTYWPFWIKLHEEEDIEIAALATKIIANFYYIKNTGKKAFKNYNFLSIEKSKDKRTIYNYTLGIYDKILKELEKKKCDNVYKHFLQNSLKKNFIERNDFFEFGWQTNDISLDIKQKIGNCKNLNKSQLFACAVLYLNSLYPEIGWKDFDPIIINPLKQDLNKYYKINICDDKKEVLNIGKIIYDEITQ